MALHDEDERRDVTYEEARAVLEAQLEMVSGVDAKAVRTVRITILLVGIVLSAWNVRPELFDLTLAFLSALALVCSLATGLFTYSESDVFLGASGAYVTRLADGEFEERPWKRDLLHTFADWIAENAEEIRFYGHLSFVTQLLLFLGIASLGLAVLYSR